MAGLVAAFVFAVQMLNFPVGAGTSGHLLGGALAAILVGPYTAVLCLAVVITVQSLFFADGGLSALGVNITLMGVVTVLVGYGVFHLINWMAPRSRTATVVASFIGALASVPVAALVFTGLYAIGGTSSIDPATVAAAMGGVHLAIGLGEGAITALTVSTVLAVRPDLVYGARGLATPLALRTASGELHPAGPAAGLPPGADRSGAGGLRPFVLGALAASVVLAGVVSFYASSSPDGLERVAGDFGFLSQTAEHPLADSALADYSVKGIEDERLSAGVAGVLGVGVSLAAGAAVTFALRRRHRRKLADELPTPTSTTKA
jgi:cobalt/nickel transport system permease protein